MHKLRLNLDALEVESFATAQDEDEARGTVRAHDYTEAWDGCSQPQTRYDEYTCGISCVNMCQHTREVPGCGVNTDFGCI